MFKKIENKIKACGAEFVSVDKNKISTAWPTRSLMRQAARIFKKKGFQIEQAQTKTAQGWRVDGYRF
jgi:hypothetical protein